MSIMGIRREINELNRIYSDSLVYKKDFEHKLYSDSLFIELNKEKALLQSKLAMAKTDSIGLTINILDSNACLELNGVIIHKTKITKYKLSRAFNGLDIISFSRIFSQPFVVSNEIASIKKEPIMVKMAPRDTSEYIPDVTPDTSNFEPVNYILEMENGIRLFVLQSDRDSTGDAYNQFVFDLKDKARNTWNSLKRVSKLNVPYYRLYIKVWIPKSDAKIIYRALPKKGLVVVYI
jgi:hypothetical protein